MTAHVSVERDTTVDQAEQMGTRLETFVSERFRIGHTVFQFETAGKCRGSVLAAQPR